MVAFKPLHPDFGVEVSGVDLTQELSDETFAKIRGAFETHSLLVFHDQDLTNDQQAAFSRRFGPLEATKADTPGAGSPIVILSNINEDGSIAQPGERAIENHRANQLWHTDSSFKPVPALASMLSAREIPPVGAETQFASCRVAHARLPEETRRRLEDKVVVHHFAHSRAKISGTLASKVERDTLPPVRQPLVRANPINGAKSYYVGSHAARIEGMADDEAETLIAELNDFATAEDRIYTHHWRVNDLVVWDNRCMLHRAQPFDTAKYRRYMIRTTVAGDGPTVSIQ